MYKEIIKNNLNKLSSAEKKVGKLILCGDINPLRDSIVKAAQIANVSTSLVNKFCIKSSFTGWKSLVGMAYVSLSKTNDNHLTFNNKISQNIINQKSVHIDTFMKNLYKKIKKAEKIFIIANGITLTLTHILKQQLELLGFIVVSLSFTTATFIIQKHDLLIFVSISGQTKKMFQYLPNHPNKSNSAYITLGNWVEKFPGLQLSLNIYNLFAKQEKVFPIITAPIMLNIIGALIKIAVNNSKISEQLDNIALKKL